MIKRRAFLFSASAVALNARRVHKPVEKIAAVAFDAFAVFDPRPMWKIAEELFAGRAAEFNSLWRSRQFEYTWLRTASGDYADFWHVTQDALAYAARALNLELTASGRERYRASFLSLRPWPDATDALEALRRAHIRMALHSNFTLSMLNSAVEGSGLDGRFQRLFSCDAVGAYKPSPVAYRMAVDGFRLRRDEIAFAAFASWDAAGAKAFGFPTFWVNRLDLPMEELGRAPDGVGTSLHELAEFVLRTRSS